MEIDLEKIVGYYFGEEKELWCLECIKGKFKVDEMDNPKRFLLKEDVEKSDHLFYCDRCKTKIG